MSLETEIRELTAAVKALTAAVRSIATGRSMNTAPATPADCPAALATVAGSAANGTALSSSAPDCAAGKEESAESAAQTAATAEQQTVKMSPESDEKAPPATAPRTAIEKAESAEGGKAELAADEYAGMDPAGFMAALHSMVKGLPNGGNVLRAALEAIGEKSFRTLDKSKYGQAIGAVKAELTKAGA